MFAFTKKIMLSLDMHMVDSGVYLESWMGFLHQIKDCFQSMQVEDMILRNRP